MKRSPAPLAAFVVLFSLACGDDPSTTSPSSQPSSIIFDGTRSDEADDFFFLPPLVPDPSTHDNFDEQGFNAVLNPAVKICELAADPNVDPATDCLLDGTDQVLVAEFGPTSVAVSAADEHYRVNWHTDESNLSPDRFYRIQVFLGTTRVGFADIDPVSSARELRSLRTGEVIPLADGRTLPIRFRIEHGVLCENESDCGEFRVTNDGGTFLTNTAFAGVRFEPGFLPEGVEEATLTIERVVVATDNRCHGESSGRLWREFEGCYSFTLDPDVAPFGGIQRPAVVGKCSELSPTDPLYDLQQGYKSRDGEGLEALPNVALPRDFGLSCEGFTGSIASARISNPVLRLALAGWRGLGAGVGRVFGVKPAYAVDLGLGDRIRIGSSFSNINWGIGLDATPIGASELEVGYGLTSDLSIRTTHDHLHEHVADDGSPVAEAHTVNVGGVMVRYEVTTGNGNFGFEADGVTPVRIRDVFTSFDDAENGTSGGLAGVSFTADENADDNEVTATAPTLLGAPVSFIIAGRRPDLVVEGLARSVEAPTSDDALSWTFTIRNAGEGRAIASVARLEIFSLDDDVPTLVQSASFDVPAAPPGQSVEVDASLGVTLAPGDYSVVVIVDAPVLDGEPPRPRVREADEENNEATELFAVLEGTGFGSVVGTVRDVTGAPVAGARVRVPELDREVVTNEAGQFLLSRLPVGEHEVIAVFPDHIAPAQTVQVGGDVQTAAFDLVPIPRGQLAVGTFHACVIAGSGATWCWGSDQFGALGRGVITGQPSGPGAIVQDPSFSTISAAGGHTCGVDAGEVGWCWGRNNFGELGAGPVGFRASPVQVLGGPWRVLSGARLTTCGLTPSGSAWCWGANQRGELGSADVPVGAGASVNTPIPVTTSLSFASISAGWIHTCAVTPSGDAHCWGRGELNGSGTAVDAPTPVAVAGGVAFHRVYAGAAHTCGITRGGEAYCWGFNSGGQLGDGSTIDRLTPVAVAGNLRFVALAVSTTPNTEVNSHTCGITTTGETYCWGRNNLGTLGTGNTDPSTVPVKVTTSETFVAIGAGDGQTCAMTSDRRVFCWGTNANGELGSGTAGGFSAIPVLVSSFP